MHLIHATNVNDALPKGLRLLASLGREQDSRVGRVRVLPVPCTTVYAQPQERVLFWPARDANPFFHLFEALWILGGRNDIAFPQRFNKRFSAYSDDGITQHAAYGKRWRSWFGTDQLEKAVQLLAANPDDRRVVIQMWDVEDLGHGGVDVPCNTHIYLRVLDDVLDLTICCRSNDIIWGAYGANAVHFSVLQEYLAARLGLGIGTLYQISNNFHAYLNVYTPLYEELKRMWPINPLNEYAVGSNIKPFPLFADDADVRDWHQDLSLFLDSPHAYGWNTVFFSQVVQPLFGAWACYEQIKDPERFFKAAECVARCAAVDWKIAAASWLSRREERTKTKEQLQRSILT